MSIFLILFLHLYINYIWLSLNTKPFFAMTPNNILTSFLFYKNFNSFILGLIKGQVKWYLQTNVHPPLHFLFPLPLYLIFGVNEKVAIMTNIIYLLITFFSIYFISQELVKISRDLGKKIGLLAIFIFSTFPLIFGSSRHFLDDMLVAAFVTLSILFLLYSNEFQNRKYSILFGISVGLGMLSKYSFFIFLVGPTIYILIKNKMKNWKNFLLGIFLGSIISVYWYYQNIHNLIWYLKKGRVMSHGPSSMDLESIGWYLYQLPNEEISLFYFLLFIFSSVHCFISRKNLKNMMVILTWFLIPFLFFSFLPNKGDVFIIPLLPSLAIIISLGIFSIQNYKIRNIFLLLIIVVGITQFFIISFTDIYLPPIYGLYLFKKSRWYSAPIREDWKIDEIIKFIDKNRDDKNVTTCLVSTYDWYKFSSFQNYVIEEGIEGIKFKEKAEDEMTYEDIWDCDYLIVKTSFDNIKHTIGIETIDKIINRPSNEFLNKFKIVEEFPLPDNSTARIYKNIHLTTRNNI